MSNANDNVITRNMTGMFANQVVFKKWGNITIACKPPVFNKDLVPSSDQQATRINFRVALAYAKKALKIDAVK